jgi:hypothetical protein
MFAVLLSVIAMATVNTQPYSTPFTLQEWYWALHGGYLDSMLGHYIRNGGLGLATLDYDPETVPFTLEEWKWAIQGGYVDSMLGQYFRNGGL